MKEKSGLLFILAFLLFGALSLQGQDPYTDVVYLKNGSVFKAKILDYRQGDTITIEIAGGHVLKFPDAEVEKIQQEGAQVKQPAAVAVVPRAVVLPKDYPVKGGYLFGTAAFSGQTGNEVFDPSLSLINFEAGGGFQFNRWLGLGAGIGYNVYDGNRGERIVPLYLEYRMYPVKNNLGPYLHVLGGYGFALKGESLGVVDAQGGYLFHPAIGWRVAAGENFFFTFDLGARWQKAQFTQENQWWLPGRTVRDVLYQRTTFRVGIQIW